MNDLAIYVHWPFCKFKCHYCDFNSHVREKIDHMDWQKAYLRELAYYRDLTGPREIKSVFFGGGTPSLMQPSVTAAVIDKIADLWGLPQGTEVTLEANPTSVETGKLRDFKAAGVNRVSMGIQSLRDADLKVLSRQHSSAEALVALKSAASVFDRFSFDLIYARPAQTLADWRQELSEALDLSGGHLSLYQLTIEEGTQYYTMHQRGELVLPDEDTAADMYELTQEMTASAGMPSYEISNHARFGDESRHNLMYWRYRDYAGIGPGAHGRLTLGDQKFATRAHRAPEVWLEKVNVHGHGAHPFEEITPQKRAAEMMMMGLRLREGVRFDDLTRETGMSAADVIRTKRAEQLAEGGYLVMTDNDIAATASGRQRLNTLLSDLLL